MKQLFSVSSDVFSVLTILKALVNAFIAITFVQTGLDKLLDYSGNKAYFTEHFKNSPFSKSINLLFPAIVLQEIIVALLSITSLIAIFIGNNSIGLFSLILSAIVFLQLYFGQRFAKDYVGASGLIPYFLVCISGIIIFSI